MAEYVLAGYWAVGYVEEGAIAIITGSYGDMRTGAFLNQPTGDGAFMNARREGSFINQNERGGDVLTGLRSGTFMRGRL